ncbi:hypothetical protein [Flavobacterium sp. I3-2]|uniref:hypothetical protein n=1 Tax=Flavobacterium sp. I3-2 TaxID=2748319 RepID=UPI0015A91FE1|nr:hypothetical protein [Flavobacterium sp. I3-2]
MKTLKSNVSILSFCFFLLPIFMFAQKEIDFGKYDSYEKVKTFFNDKTNESDFAYGYYKTYKKGLWNGIPITEIVMYENEISFAITKEQKNATLQIVNYLTKKYNNSLDIDTSYWDIIYRVKTNEMSLNFEVDVDKDEKISDETTSKMTLRYKNVTDNKLAKISSDLESISNGSEYYLNLDYFQVSPQVYINGLPVFKETAKSRHVNDGIIFLNKFILESGSPVNIKFVIEPGNDNDGKPYDNIIKESYFTALIETVNANGANSRKEKLYSNKEYVTDTITEDGKTRYSSYPGTYSYGKKKLEFKYTLNPRVEYKVSAWNNGKDLRNEKDLEQKIKTFYSDFSKLIMEKNIDKITEILYPKYADFYTYSYNFGTSKSIDDYESWLETVQRTFKTSSAEKTKLHISYDGKLAYLESLDKTTNLKTIGKEYVKDIDFIFYIDETTNQLIPIR